MKKQAKLIALDYDGTLAQSNSRVSDKEKEFLEKLGKKGFLRVVATGRSLFSADEVMEKDLPIDYIVFSSGVGVMNWKTRKIISYNSLKADKAEKLSKWLIEKEQDFMIHHPVPDNHHFYYYESSYYNPDFRRRIIKYQDFAIPYNQLKKFDKVSQFVVISNKNGLFWLGKLKMNFPNMNIVRTTSPLDNESIWIEVFPKCVSKASGIKFLAKKYNIEQNEIFSVGNDYNDVDMLRFSENSYVVSSAPENIRKEFKCLNCDGGKVVENISDILGI